MIIISREISVYLTLLSIREKGLPRPDVLLLKWLLIIISFGELANCMLRLLKVSLAGKGRIINVTYCNHNQQDGE
jgi:hypothetical protein